MALVHIKNIKDLGGEKKIQEWARIGGEADHPLKNKENHTRGKASDTMKTGVSDWMTGKGGRFKKGCSAKQTYAMKFW